MMAFHISDFETDQLVRLLANHRQIGITEAVRVSVRNELIKDGVEIPQAAFVQGVPDDTARLLVELDAVIRSTTLEYTRLLAKERGKKHGGSRVYQMLSRHGAVGTLGKLVEKPTDGLAFLKSIDRLDLSAEAIALDPKYKSLISEVIRARAKSNMKSV